MAKLKHGAGIICAAFLALVFMRSADLRAFLRRCYKVLTAWRRLFFEAREIFAQHA
jgi:hypothetical protein